MCQHRSLAKLRFSVIRGIVSDLGPVARKALGQRVGYLLTHLELTSLGIASERKNHFEKIKLFPYSQQFGNSLCLHK